MRWSAHALKNLTDREIPRAEAEAALANPEMSTPGRPGRRFLMRRFFDTSLHQEMLVRVLIEEGSLEDVVVTVYKTSKIGKHMREAGP